MTLFADLAKLLDDLAREASRLKKRAAIAAAIERVHLAAPNAPDAGLFVLYLAGMPFAEWDPRKLNAGGALLSRAVKDVSGADDAQLAAAYRRHGDLGAAAFDLLHGKEILAHSAPLTLSDVSEAFTAMAAARTTAARGSLVDGLLRRATPIEAKYLVKLMLGDMRTGVKQPLVEEGIAVAAKVPVAEVRHAVMLEADLAHAVARAFAGTLAEARMRLFHPLGFMLASPVESPEEAVERFSAPPKGRAATKAADGTGEGDEEGVPAEDETGASDPRAVAAYLEDKYDGMRAQVHFGDPEQPGRVAIYSRNREDITESYPELEEAFAAAALAVPIGPTVLDGEILGWNFGQALPSTAAGVPGSSQSPRDEWENERAEAPSLGVALPFAVLGTRIGRKRVSDEMRARVPVIFMAFDLMVERGELILHLPLRERRNRLEALAERLTTHAASPLETVRERNGAQSALFSLPTGNSQLARLHLSPTRLVESAEDIDRAYAAARALE